MLNEKLLKKTFAQIVKKGKVIGKAQNHKSATYSLWRDEKDFDIDWSKPSEVVLRHIHASSYPYVGARSVLNGEEVRVFDGKVSKENPRIINRTPGKIWKITNGVPVVICGSGLIELTKVSGNGFNLSGTSEFTTYYGETFKLTNIFSTPLIIAFCLLGLFTLVPTLIKKVTKK